MICPNCGNEVRDGAKFCTKCGSTIVQAAAQIQPKSAQPAGAVCQKCGSPLKPGAKFCTKCGTPQQAVQAQEDKTVFIQEQSTPQPQVQPQQAVYGTVVPTPTYPEQTAEDTGKKKKGGSGAAVAICLGIILVIALSVTTVLLLTQVFDVSILPGSSSKTASSNKNDDEEESSEEESTEDEDKLQSVKDLIASGDYETAISTLAEMLSGDDADEDSAAEIKSLLQEAVQGKSGSVMTQADSYASSGDYDNAYAAIDNALTYFQGYETNDAVYQYVDTQALNEKKSSIQEKQKTALLEEAQKCANSADETGVDSAFSTLATLMDSEELEEQKIGIYSDLVIQVVFSKQNAGESATSIMSYIDEHLDETGNNCWVLELWDYNNALNIIETGQKSIESTVKHVSSSGYLLEDSAYMELSESDISGLTQYELHLALYEIYARHGRTFNDDAVNEYFSQYSWYKGTVSFENFDDESTLNEYEKYNRDLIVNYQRQMGYR